MKWNHLVVTFLAPFSVFAQGPASAPGTEGEQGEILTLIRDYKVSALRGENVDLFFESVGGCQPENANPHDHRLPIEESEELSSLDLEFRFFYIHNVTRGDLVQRRLVVFELVGEAPDGLSYEEKGIELIEKVGDVWKLVPGHCWTVNTPAK